MIALESIEFRYPVGAFRLVVPELRVARGETLAVVGASGSGKSTLLSLVAGILVPGVGTATVDGVEVSALAEPARRDFRLHRLGLVFQEFELLDHLDVRDNVLLPYRMSPRLQATAEDERRAERLVEEVGLGGKWRRNVRRLSQGERQRVALARGLLLDPPVLLCDEPTGNLDPSTTDEVLALLLERVKERGTTLVVVTHDHGLLPGFDRVLDVAEFQEVGA
ncbi:MAG: ABC transporter ATP-binding protein [Planctomycetota bacterium]